MKKQRLFAISAACLSLILLTAVFSACSSGGGGAAPGPVSGNSVQLTGSIASATGASGLKAARAAAGPADTVWAIPIAKIQGANIDVVNFILKKTSTIDGSGNFTFTLEKTISLADILAKVPDMDTTGMDPNAVFDVDWMLVQMAGATPVGMISLQGDATYDNLLSIPLSAFTPGTMNIGTVDGTSGVATLSVSSLASDLTMTASSLAALSRTDDVLSAMKDVIRNCDLATNKCITATQSFVFMGDYANIIDPTTFDQAKTYTGYQIYFQVNDYYDKSDFDAICPGSAGPVTLEYTLTPPGPISLQTVTYDTTNALSTSLTDTGNPTPSGDNSETRCFKNNLYLTKDNNASYWALQFITGDLAEQLTTDTPAGDWVLKRNNSEIGRFEFALAKPVDANGNPIVFVPAIRFDTDGTADKGVTTLHVKWYQYNGTGYVEITDAVLLNSLLGSYEISLDDENGITGNTGLRRAQQWGIDFSVNTIDVSNLDGLGPFFYDYPNADKYKLRYAGISYLFGGQSFRFVWRSATN